MIVWEDGPFNYLFGISRMSVMKGKNRTFTFNEEQIKDAIEFALDDTVLM
jgi:hypothetical protein